MGEHRLAQDRCLVEAEASRAGAASRAEATSCVAQQEDAQRKDVSSQERSRKKQELMLKASIAQHSYKTSWVAAATSLASSGLDRKDIAAQAHKIAGKQIDLYTLNAEASKWNFLVKVSLESSQVVDLLETPQDRKKKRYAHEYQESGEGLADGLIAEDSWDREAIREMKRGRARKSDALYTDPSQLLYYLRSLVSEAQNTTGWQAADAKQVLKEQLAWVVEDGQSLCSFEVTQELVQELLSHIRAEISQAYKAKGRLKFENPTPWPGRYAKKPHSQATEKFAREQVHLLMGGPIVERKY